MKSSDCTKKTEYNSEIIDKALSTFSEYSILVIGDIMVDEYLWGAVTRISHEAPVQIVNVEKQEYRLGGCGNVVNNLCSLGASVSVVSVSGNDSFHKFVFQELGRLGVGTECLLLDNERPTTIKTRVLSGNQQLARIDIEKRNSISSRYEQKIAEYIERNAGSFDVILLPDYAKGVLTQKVLSTAIENGKQHMTPVLIDPKVKDFSIYSRAMMVTPNKSEAEIASDIEIKGNDTAEKAARNILLKTKCDAVLITRGSSGMTLLENADDKATHITGNAKEVYDVSGAGDTVLSVLGLGIASGLSFKEASLLANVAGGIVVGKRGTATVSREELLSFINEEECKKEHIKERTLKELESLVHQLKLQKKQIVFTNGSFNILHGGHIQHLQKAKTLGDVLIVGTYHNNSFQDNINSHWRLISKEDQIHILSTLDYVDYVVISENENPMNIIITLKPDIVVEHKANASNETERKETVEKYGGKVVVVI